MPHIHQAIRGYISRLSLQGRLFARPLHVAHLVLWTPLPQPLCMPWSSPSLVLAPSSPGIFLASNSCPNPRLSIPSQANVTTLRMGIFKLRAHHILDPSSLDATL